MKILFALVLLAASNTLFSCSYEEENSIYFEDKELKAGVLSILDKEKINYRDVEGTVYYPARFSDEFDKAYNVAQNMRPLEFTVMSGRIAEDLSRRLELIDVPYITEREGEKVIFTIEKIYDQRSRKAFRETMIENR